MKRGGRDLLLERPLDRVDLAQCRNAADVLRCLHRGITRPKREPVFPAWAHHWLQVPAMIRGSGRWCGSCSSAQRTMRSGATSGEHGVDVEAILASSGAAVR